MELVADTGLPRHVAIIMDGNGRWATARGLPRVAGHRRGADAVRRTVTAAAELGVEYLTLFGFSSENWKRPVAEIGDLMGLLRLYLRSEVAELQRNGVRLRVIGDRARLPDDVTELIAHAEDLTGANDRLNLTVALSYGSRDEITQACRAVARAVEGGSLAADAIDETTLARHLWTVDLPDPDLVIRTSGEVRISNFLLWQAAYAEFVFVDTLWPDFARADLERAVDIFRGRERRYGATTAQVR